VIPWTLGPLWTEKFLRRSRNLKRVVALRTRDGAKSAKIGGRKILSDLQVGLVRIEVSAVVIVGIGAVIAGDHPQEVVGVLIRGVLCLGNIHLVKAEVLAMHGLSGTLLLRLLLQTLPGKLNQAMRIKQKPLKTIMLQENPPGLLW